MFGKKPMYSREEMRKAAEYIDFKERVHEARSELKAYVDWLESELEETEKLWANFHRFFVASYIYLRGVLPYLQKPKTYGYEEEPKLYDFSGGFRLRCPFDEDSYYEVKYDKETPVDVAKIPYVFSAPHDPNGDKALELTEGEYIAFNLFRIIKDNLQKVKRLLEFDDDPLDFSIKMMREMVEAKDSYGLELWTYAATYEQNPEIELAEIEVLYKASQNNYVEYLGI